MPDHAPDDVPTIDELGAGTPLCDVLHGDGHFTPWGTPQPGDTGYVVITAARRLRPHEWIAVKLLRRPDPRAEIHPVELHGPAEPSADTVSFTVSLD